jgi:hypothetical protein
MICFRYKKVNKELICFICTNELGKSYTTLNEDTARSEFNVKTLKLYYSK